jgi:hypothetical protein
MSITEPEKIDIVASKPGSAVVKLIIADHLAWENLDAHARALQEKINVYLEFIKSGQLHELEDTIVPEHPEVHIVLAVQHSPSPEGESFLAQIREFLASLSIHFEVELRPARR